MRLITILILAITASAMIGCSKDDEADVSRDLAACNVKAIEVYKPKAPVGIDDMTAVYLSECMKAAGYRLDMKCIDKMGAWVTPTCWYR